MQSANPGVLCLLGSRKHYFIFSHDLDSLRIPQLSLDPAPVHAILLSKTPQSQFHSLRRILIQASVKKVSIRDDDNALRSVSVERELGVRYLSVWVVS